MNAYTGGCHCGKVKYEVKTDLEGAITCNCSICSKRGSILVFVPVQDFTLLSGEDALTQYTFNKHVIDHLFCATCGILSFAKGKGPDGADMRAINVRCLDDVDIDSVKTTQVDGKSF